MRSELRAQGLVPLEVKAVAESHANKSDKRGLKTRRLKIKRNELSILTRQMATLLESGMTVEETLGALIKQSEGHRIKSVISDVRSLVTEGYSLSNTKGQRTKGTVG